MARLSHDHLPGDEPARRRSVQSVGVYRMRAAVAGIVAVVAMGILASSPSAAAPGSPGVMVAPNLVLYESFENTVENTSADFVQTIDDYDDGLAPPVAGYVGSQGQTYDADPAWNGQFCNGLILMASDPENVPVLSQTNACQEEGWDKSRHLSQTLGMWAAHADYPYPGLPDVDPMLSHAVTAYTQGDTPPGEMVSTEVAAVPGHYYSASVDVAQTNCWTDDEVHLSLQLSDALAGPVAVFPGPIAACDLPVHELNGDHVGTFVGRDSFLASGTSVKASLVNVLGGGGGDDNAFDNFAVIDTTPQLDAYIAPGPFDGAYASNQAARLSYTVTNTYLPGFPDVPSGPKEGWSFQLPLPAGLHAAEPMNAATDCVGGSILVSADTLTSAGSLSGTACSLSIDVTSAGGLYTLDPAVLTSVGVLDPNAASVSFVGESALPVMGVGTAPMLAVGGALLALGLLLIGRRARRA